MAGVEKVDPGAEVLAVPVDELGFDDDAVLGPPVVDEGVVEVENRATRELSSQTGYNGLFAVNYLHSLSDL